MSIESLPPCAAPTAPAAPPPAGPAVAGASPVEANGTPGPAAGQASTASAEGAAGSSQNTPASRSPRPEAGRSTGRKAAAADPVRGTCEPARTAGSIGSRPQAEPRRGSFSQTLAESQAAAGRGSGARHGATPSHAQHSDTAAHAPAKGGKLDPVGTALALLSPRSPGVPAAPSGRDPVNTRSAPASASAAAKGLGRAARTLLARTAAQDVQAPAATAGPGASASATTSSPAAAAVTGGVPAGSAPRAAMPTHAAASLAARLSASVGTDGWTEELGARLTWMTHQGVQSATLQLSPEHLGPLQVSISVQHGAASVWFGAAHADTRQALEQAMPQLRQMLSGQGLTLTDSGVSRDAPREQTPPKASGQPLGAIAEESAAGESGSSRARLGMVDAYA